MHGKDEQFTFVRCADCGLIQLNPRVKPEDLGVFYREYYLPFRGPSAWGRYAPLVAMNLAGTDRRRTAIARKAAAIDQSSRVLDVGCGKPSFLKLVNEKTGCRAKGIDFSDEGWRHEPEQYRNLELEVAEFRNFTDEGPFDLITMWHYLEHDYNPRATLEKMRTMVAPRGRLVIEVPNFDSWTRVLQGSHWEGYHTPRHTAVYSPSTLHRLLNNSGWRIERLYPYGTLDPYPLFWMGRQEKKGIDWSRSMEDKFPGFMAGMLVTFPVFLLKRWIPAGLMMVVARPDESG
ncbi:MAG: class I SAM-dependent methyltransferase [Sediminispirochaetaceae bacterium]